MLLQVVLHSRIAQEEGSFTLDDVIRGISEKMVRRHPHVFGGGLNGDTPTWEEIKKQEHAGREPESIFEGIPEEFPALIRGQKILKRAEGECPELGQRKRTLEKMQELLDKLKKTQNEEETDTEKEIIASLLLYCVNFLRIRDAHAEQTLNDYLDKIVKSGENTAKNLDKYL